MRRIGNGSFTYYGTTYCFLQNALKDYPVRGKSVLVCGLEACNCDMISVYHGADKVYVTDYQPVQHDHPQVQSYHVDDFVKSGIKVDIFHSLQVALWHQWVNIATKPIVLKRGYGKCKAAVEG